MSANESNHPGEWYREWCRQSTRTEYERTLRCDHGRRLTELAVIRVCHTVMEGELWGISTNAFSKRIGRWYHRLREVHNIPLHTRPRLNVKSMEKLIAFIREIPLDIRYADALDGVLVYCIRYRESGLEGWRREHPTASDESVDPQDIPEGW